MQEWDFDVIVIGAGVIGLASAAELTRRRLRVIILERNDRFGQEISSRNSEIIHAGIYYTPGSNKARLCVEGSELLYRFCAEHQVPYRKTGKLIVAADEREKEVLELLLKKAHGNGANAVHMITAAEVRVLEPAVQAAAALYSPQTGIVDSHKLMLTLLHIAESGGATVAYQSAAAAIEPISQGYRLCVQGHWLSTRSIVNAAGLAADQIASQVGLDIDRLGYRLQFAKGSYFAYGACSPVSRLIYPVPKHDLAGLGVHGTLDMSGRLRFGPDVEFLEDGAALDYRVDPSRVESFYHSASRLIKGLQREAFQPDFAGIRPKLRPLPGKSEPRDFVINHEVARGLPGFINLIGIESPGLTAALAIARVVTDTLEPVLS